MNFFLYLPGEGFNVLGPLPHLFTVLAVLQGLRLGSFDNLLVLIDLKRS